MVGDFGNERRQKRRWQIVTPAGDDPEPRAGDVGGGVPARRNANERIVRAVHDQRRGANAPERPDPALRRLDGDEMPRPAVRMRTPAERALDLGSKFGVAGRVSRAADQPQERDGLRNPAFGIAARAPSKQAPQHRGLGPAMGFPLVDMSETRLLTRSG